mmetsp:Transcript_22966/g.74827  ORF Transcript_22966/g.74827 Transcript_22966/m.74827 type:complete len:238 (-) Transcript_22966:294-1007(-)
MSAFMSAACSDAALGSSLKASSSSSPPPPPLPPTQPLVRGIPPSASAISGTSSSCTQLDHRKSTTSGASSAHSATSRSATQRSASSISQSAETIKTGGEDEGYLLGKAMSRSSGPTCRIAPSTPSAVEVHNATGAVCALGCRRIHTRRSGGSSSAPVSFSSPPTISKISGSRIASSAMSSSSTASASPASALTPATDEESSSLCSSRATSIISPFPSAPADGPAPAVSSLPAILRYY